MVQLCLGPDSGHGQKYINDRMIISAWNPDNDPERLLKPSVLRIENLVFTWTVLRDLLRPSLHDCLRELILVDSPLPKSFFKALMAVSRSTVICEDLEKLSVIYESRPYTDERTISWSNGREILKSILTLRREQNMGLRRVIAQWPRQPRVEFSDDS